MDNLHFKSLNKCYKEYKIIIPKVITNPGEITQDELKKIKLFKILDMMYYYLSENKDININDVYESVRNDYENFRMSNPDNQDNSNDNLDNSENSSSTSFTISSNTTSETSEEDDESSDSDSESELDSDDSDSEYSTKSDDEEYYKMVNLGILHLNKNQKNKEILIIRN